MGQQILVDLLIQEIQDYPLTLGLPVGLNLPDYHSLQQVRQNQSLQLLQDYQGHLLYQDFPSVQEIH